MGTNKEHPTWDWIIIILAMAVIAYYTINTH